MGYDYTIWILIVPFAAFLVTGLLGNKMNPKLSGIIGTVGLLVVTILSYYTAYKYFFFDGNVHTGVYKSITGFNMEWLQFSDKLSIDIGVLLDPISVMMLVVISTVSLMVHIYSFGYMHGESGFVRYY